MRTFHWICFGLFLLSTLGLAGFTVALLFEKAEVAALPAHRTQVGPAFTLEVGETGAWEPDWDLQITSQARIDFDWNSPVPVPRVRPSDVGSGSYTVDEPRCVLEVRGLEGPAVERAEELQLYGGGLLVDPLQARRLSWRVTRVRGDHVGEVRSLQVSDWNARRRDTAFIDLGIYGFFLPATVVCGILALLFGRVLHRDRKPTPVSAP